MASLPTIPFAIHKSVIGSHQHLVVTSEPTSVTESATIPQGMLTFGTQGFDEVAKLYCEPVPTFPQEATQKAYRELFANPPSVPMPWRFCIPYKAYRRSVEDLVERLRVVVGSMGELGYYRGPYQRGNEVFGYLERARVDETLWEKFSQEPGSVGTTAKSFRPDADGYAGTVEYDRTETVTGRLKVKDGPNILHLKHEHRSMVVSRFGNSGSIWSLDYSSLEPRVLLSFGHNRGTLPKERDIYMYLLKELFHNASNLTRADVKKVVLSEVYGAGMSTLSKELTHVSNLNRVVEAIEEFFSLRELKKRLNQEASDSKFQWLTTPYGRRVSIVDASPYMYPNRVVQSTAVDVAMLGFLSILEQVKELDLLDRVVPLFVLHDALILDVHENVVKALPTLCKTGSRDIQGFEDMLFYLSSERFK